MKRTEIIGKKLAELRLQHGYTQAELSEKLGVAQTTYAGYETGRSEPSIDILIHLAEIYKTSLDFLAGRYENPANKDDPDEIKKKAIEYAISDPNPIKRKVFQYQESKIAAGEMEDNRSPETFKKYVELEEKKRAKYNRVKTNRKPQKD